MELKQNDINAIRYNYKIYTAHSTRTQHTVFKHGRIIYNQLQTNIGDGPNK